MRPWIKNCVNATSEGLRDRAYRNGDIALAPRNYITEGL